MRSGHLPRWEDNYAPFYCPENPLPRRPRRPPAPPPPRLFPPVARQPAVSPPPRQRTNLAIGPQTARWSRYGRNPDELPTEQFRIFSSRDKDSGIIICTMCCCFFFIIPSTTLIIGATVGSLQINIWPLVAVAVICCASLLVIYVCHCKEKYRLSSRLQRSRNVSVYVNSPPSYSRLDSSTQATVDSPPSYTTQPQTGAPQTRPSSTQQPNTTSQLVWRESSNPNSDETCLLGQPPSYDEAISSGGVHEQELEQLPLLSPHG